MTYGVFNSAAFKTAAGIAVAPLASVEVRREVDNALATIYAAAAGGALGNPFAADAQGRFTLYAAGIPLGYKVTVTSGAESFALRNVPIGTAMYLDEAAFATAADIATLTAALAATAPLASPALTGDPTAPTASPGDSDTSIATTAFVAAALAAKADLASPALTGNPTAPTASPGDSDTSIATTAFVAAAVAAGAPQPVQGNLLINGNWLLDQINEGALYTVSGSVQGPDGWTGNNGGGTGVFKVRTIVDPDNAALRCMEISCTTADGTIAAGDLYHLYAAIEGYDIADLKSGLASAGSVSLRFKFKTSVTGVYGVSLGNQAGNRSRVEIITVANTSENEYTITFPLDVAGTWLYTNGVGLYLRICLAAGSTYQKAAGAWAADNCYSTSAQATFMASTSNIAYLKRIQLTPGATVVPYGPQDMQKELAKALRSFEVLGSSSGTESYGVGQCASTTRALAFYPFKTIKRGTPTVTLSAANHWAFFNNAISAFVPWVTVVPQGSAYGCVFDVSGMTGLGGAGQAALFGPNSTSAARMYFNARLS